MAIQLSELQTEYGLLKQDISNVPEATYLAWCRYVENFVYNRLLATEPARFLETQSYNAINGSQALPVGFKNIRPHGSGFFLLNQDGTLSPTNNLLPVTSYGSEFPGYYLEGNNVVFTQFPTSTPVMLRYIPKLTRLTSTAQYFTVDGTASGTEIIEEEYLDYLIYALDVWYGIWDGEPSAEAMSDQRFVRALSELIDNYKRNPRAIGIFNPSNIY